MNLEDSFPDYTLWMQAGLILGEEEVCKNHFRYSRQYKAEMGEYLLRKHTNIKNAQVYPCPFCGGWHVRDERIFRSDLFQLVLDNGN